MLYFGLNHRPSSGVKLKLKELRSLLHWKVKLMAIIKWVSVSDEKKFFLKKIAKVATKTKYIGSKWESRYCRNTLRRNEFILPSMTCFCCWHINNDSAIFRFVIWLSGYIYIYIYTVLWIYIYSTLDIYMSYWKSEMDQLSYIHCWMYDNAVQCAIMYALNVNIQ